MLALAVALGFSLWRVVAGVSDLVSTLLIDNGDAAYLKASQPLTWEVGQRVLTLGNLFRGLIELAVVGLIALIVLRRSRTLR